MRVRRSGSLRSIWYKRERKRLPAHLRPVVPAPVAPVPKFPTEAHWHSGDPRAMVRCVVRLASDPRIVFHMTAPAVARKLRLYYCALARHRWDLLPDDVRELVCVLERHADGVGNGRALRATRAAARAALQAAQPTTWTLEVYQQAWERVHAVGLVVEAAEVREQLQSWSGWAGTAPATADPVGLLHELFDNPFHPTELNARWFSSDVLQLARYIYAERAFDLMPVLGDALQDAGCDSPGVLDHCYGSHRHIAGCWLVDRLADPWVGAR